MSILFQYLLKLSISLAVVYLFYYFLLRKLTFYNSNRWYLLLYSCCSFLIPLVNVYPVLKRNQLEVSGIVDYIPAVSSTITMSDPEVAQAIAYEDARLIGLWAVVVLISGAIVMLTRLIIQYISFLRVKRSSMLVVADPIRIFQVNESIIPFSIGNSIFINQHLHQEEELREIIRHEFIHVKQKHTVDIFLSELLCVLNWYNPFAWMIRRAIKANLEYIADNKVLEGGLDRKKYQYLLLKVIGAAQFSITTQFNFSSLKKRIAMMNKKQSAKPQLLKLFLLLPVVLVVLLAFRSAGDNFRLNFQEPANYRDTIPPKPAKPESPRMHTDDFLKRNSSVRNVEIRNNILTIELKSGGKETYSLSKPEDVEAVEKKYGHLQIVPSPPPPPPAPPKPALPRDVKSISITESKAVVVLSNGNKEEYDLTKEEELEAFQSKYQMAESREELEQMHRKMEMELLARKDEMSNLKRLEREYELLRKAQEAELMELHNKREAEMKLLSKEKQKEVELLQKKLYLEAESEMLKRKLELDAPHKEELNHELELKQKMMLSQMHELKERNAMLEKINADSKNLSADERKEVITQLEIQKKELNKLMQELKSKENEINRQIQDLKKASGRN